MEKETRKNLVNISFIILAIILWTYTLVSPLDKETIPLKFSLSETSGFDLTREKLTLGSITPNQSGSRGLEIENQYNRRIKIVIEARGEAAESIIVSDNNFFLEPFEKKDLMFTAYTHGLTEYREYLGEVIILSKRA